MKRLVALPCLLLLAITSIANTIIVKNIDELNEANKKAKPGDIIELQNGEWKNVSIRLTCHGTAEQPITFRAQTAGKVLVTGLSQLKLGGEYIIVDGLYFTNGYAGKDPVINFRADAKQLANHCRVTNISVNDFNNPKRMDENNWVLFYGKNNRLDHSSFRDKKNMGVLIAVILDDERSRENYHAIDHNYFGRRPPLASNGGEMIRVGVSQHCEFYSNTQMNDNFFEQCDGETEIISVKSCGNVVKGNVFKECQGGVVLRHGNYNTVENNLFLGNGKPGTGGVRIINKGQWVINNFFYGCRGVDFRSPMSVMNGIPNSPAHRYVQVTDAVIANNTFYDCSSISFGEGSDAERTLAPEHVVMSNNIFYNTTDSLIYRAFDKIDGFSFSGNAVSTAIRQPLPAGFIKTSFGVQKSPVSPMPVISSQKIIVSDSLQKVAQERLGHSLSSQAGFSTVSLLKTIHANAYAVCGAAWFKPFNHDALVKTVTVKCATAEEVYRQLERKEPLAIELTGTQYSLDKPFRISKTISFRASSAKPVRFDSKNILAIFVVAGNGNLSLNKLVVDGGLTGAKHFISSDASGSSAHYNVSVTKCSVSGFSAKNGCETIFFAYKSMVADSIVFNGNNFTNNAVNGILMKDEKDDKGYYSAEKIAVVNNRFTNQQGILMDIYRGGNDESTLGPNLVFANNQIKGCNTEKGNPLISFTGVQVTNLKGNQFIESNATGVIIAYKDIVRARHWLEKNTITGSGRIEKDQFVIAD